MKPLDRRQKRVLRYALLMALGFLMNIYLHQLALYFNWPMWLDYTGTVLCAVALETTAGLLVGLGNNFVEALIANSPSLIIYYGVSASIALIAGILMRKNGRLCWKRIPLTAAVMVLVSGVLSTLLTFWQSDGVLSLNAEISYFNQLLGYGWPNWLAVFVAQLIVKVYGVLATAGIVTVIYLLLPRWLKPADKEAPAAPPAAG